MAAPRLTVNGQCSNIEPTTYNNMVPPRMAREQVTMFSPDAHPPLRGLRVLDASRVLAGPFCGQLLGDLGAEVIKVERPGSGDETRTWGPPFAGPLSAYYLSCNRNKRDLTLDLGQTEGHAI